jgi:2TM domain-containing protein
MTSDLDALADPLRDRAVKQLKKRRDFMSHLLVYVLVNSFIVLIWVITGSGGFLADLSHGWLGHRRGHECIGRLASS